MVVMIKGDDKQIKFQRKMKVGDQYVIIMELPQKMFITFKKDINDNKYLFQKTLENGDIVFDSNTGYYSFLIKSTDTDDISFEGDHTDIYFDIEIIEENLKKTIKRDTLRIEYEITNVGNEG